jgi:hypothetical protein
LVQLHARAAGIGKNVFDAFAFQRLDENVATFHRLADFGAFGFLFRFCYCAHTFLSLAADEVNKKPTTVSSRGFLSKFALRATRPNGVVSYDDSGNYKLQRD